ncbi:MAG: hypothetical protein ACXVRS_13655 [Gaiellaceae bacterium]
MTERLDRLAKMIAPHLPGSFDEIRESMGQAFDASILSELERAFYIERRPAQETGAASRFDSRDEFFLTPARSVSRRTRSGRLPLT